MWAELKCHAIYTKNGLHNVLMDFKGSMLGGDFHLATDIPITDPDADDP